LTARWLLFLPAMRLLLISLVTGTEWCRLYPDLDFLVPLSQHRDLSPRRRVTRSPHA
jgi:hypothetical protein